MPKKARLSFPPFPNITVSSQLGPTSEDFAAHPLGWQAGQIFWLKDKQTFWVLPQGFAEHLMLPFARGPSQVIWRPLKTPESHGAVGRVWGSLSVEQLVALVGQYLDLRWPGRGQVGEACAQLCSGDFHPTAP